MTGKIPGTFKNRPAPLIRDRSPHGVLAEEGVMRAGSLVASSYYIGECSVMVSRDPVGPNGEGRWHLSIAHPSRYPTWDEIKAARYTAPELTDVPLMAQLLPLIEDDAEWVNAHDSAFHLHEITEHPHG